jgi:hypothetical protein
MLLLLAYLLMHIVLKVNLKVVFADEKLWN